MTEQMLQLKQRINNGEIPSDKELDLFTKEQLIDYYSNSLNVINAQKDHIKLLKSQTSGLREGLTVEEFGRKCFYEGRVITRYDEHKRAIFSYPTYMGYLRENKFFQR